MKKLLVVLLIIISVIGESQNVNKLFDSSYVNVSWLGIDFSHVKLIGDFSQFNGAGEKNYIQIRDEYFPAWNKLIINEPNKYDIKGMLERNSILYDIDMIMKRNAKTPIDKLESYSTPNYTVDDLKRFISSYDLDGKSGIGIIFLAESLSKSYKEAYFHFIAINLKTKEILLHEKLLGKPKGFGLRNYWAGSIYNVIKKIKWERYDIWKNQYDY